MYFYPALLLPSALPALLQDLKQIIENVLSSVEIVRISKLGEHRKPRKFYYTTSASEKLRLVMCHQSESVGFIDRLQF